MLRIIVVMYDGTEVDEYLDEPLDQLIDHISSMPRVVLKAAEIEDDRGFLKFRLIDVQTKE